MNPTSKFKPHQTLLIRLTLLILLLTLISAWIGSWLIPTALLYQHHFYIYPNLGKILIFTPIIYYLFTKDNTPNFPQPQYINKLLLINALLLIPTHYYLAQTLLKSPSPTLLLLAHTSLILIPLTLTTALLTKSWIKSFLQQNTKTLLKIIPTSLILYLLIFQLWELWPYFSSGVLQSLVFILTPFYEINTYPPHTLIIEKFSVSIAKACSGLDSIALYIGFMAIIAYIERHRLNISTYTIIFTIGLIGVYFLNILRVLLLLLIGVHISPELALGLFHTYAGLILFLAYFWSLLSFSYKKIINEL